MLHDHRVYGRLLALAALGWITLGLPAQGQSKLSPGLAVPDNPAVLKGAPPAAPPAPPGSPGPKQVQPNGPGGTPFTLPKSSDMVTPTTVPKMCDLLVT